MDKGARVGQRRMEKALLKGGRSGHRNKWSVYKRTEKNEEGFVITGEEWTEIQEECSRKDREWIRPCQRINHCSGR
jgi:hypothetical protein